MADVLHLEVAKTDSDFQVLVFVNDVEMTSLGAGLGMDPYDVFVPSNRLRVQAEPFETPIARCTCGIYGCGSTDVRIVLEESRVRWDWLIEKPAESPLFFERAHYDLVLDRLDANTSWETPDRTAGRLVLGGIDRSHLAKFDLRPSFVCNDWKDPSSFEVVLAYRETHQIFLRFPWSGVTPDVLANNVLSTLAAHPVTWTASWHQADPKSPRPLAFAARWDRERL